MLAAMNSGVRGFVALPMSASMTLRRLSIAAGLLLVTAPDAQPQVSTRRFSVDSLRERCITLTEVKQGSEPGDYRECRVSEFGDLGVVAGRRYYYAIYCLLPVYAAASNGRCAADSFNSSEHRTRAVVIFAGDSAPRDVELVFERASAEIGMYIYRPPIIVSHAAGTLLYLPIAMDGTGNYNRSEYYLREGGRWEQVDSESWIADLAPSLPEDLEVWKGIWPDPRTLSAEVGLYRKADANCCPTGGTLGIQLAIRNRRFVLVRVQWSRRR